MKIAGREISRDMPPYIVIDIAAGHPGTTESIVNLMRAIKASGADAAKIQVYTPECLTIDCPHEDFILRKGLWKGKPLWEIHASAKPFGDNLPALFEAAHNMGLTLFASVFSKRFLPELESLGCPAYKIASAEARHLELLLAVGATGKPVIISTGAISLSEAHEAVGKLPGESALLHCVSQYPTPVEEACLSDMRELQRHFDSDLIGLSDHSHGWEVAIAAVALGAAIIEKHVALPGTLDAGFALRPYQLSGFCHTVRQAWKVCREVTAISPDKFRLRRSVRAIADIAAGDVLSRENIAVIRPAGGADPFDLPLMLGSRAKRAFKRGDGILISDRE